MLAGSVTHFLLAGLVLVPGNDDGDSVGVSRSYFDYLISARDRFPRKPSATVGGAKPRVTCSYQRWWYVHGLQKVGQEYADPDKKLSTEPVEDGARYLVECSNGTRNIVWIENKRAPVVIAEQLAQRAYKRIPIAPPQVLHGSATWTGRAGGAPALVLPGQGTVDGQDQAATYRRSLG